MNETNTNNSLNKKEHDSASEVSEKKYIKKLKKHASKFLKKALYITIFLFYVFTGTLRWKVVGVLLVFLFGYVERKNFLDESKIFKNNQILLSSFLFV